MKNSASAKRILVIDDEPRLAQSLASLLRGVGYEVRAAIGGPEGLKCLNSEEYDLVITDLRMPEVSGFEIMHHIAERRPRTALIVITGHASTESAIEALHLDAHDYIPKPFDFDLLRASVDKVFARLETEQLKADLARMFSHDIKVPLTSVVGFGEFLAAEGGLQNERAREFACKIVANSRRILALIENYITHSRIEDGHFDINRERVDASALAREALRAVEFDFQQRHLVIESQLAEDLCVLGDEGLLFRAIANLLNNAAKYTPDGGRVWMSVEAIPLDGGAPGIALSVGNSGVRLDPIECEGLFDRYRRGRTSRGTGGVGLGLHVVRCVARAHGGEAICVSRPEQSEVVFQIMLPQAADQAREPAADSVPAEA